MIDGIEREMATVSILSVDGRLLKQIERVGIRELDFNDIPNGIYILRVLNPNINYSRKIVKQ